MWDILDMENAKAGLVHFSQSNLQKFLLPLFACNSKFMEQLLCNPNGYYF